MISQQRFGGVQPLRLITLLFLVAVMALCAGVSSARTESRTEAGTVTDTGREAAASLDARRARASQEIAELQRRYGQATDLINRNAPDVSRCQAIYRRIFTADAKIAVMGQDPVAGPDAWLDIVRRTQSTLLGSQHMIGSQVVEITQLPDQQGLGGAATMTSYLMASQIGAEQQHTSILGTYVTEVRHSAEAGWQMSQMTLQLLSVETRPPAAQ